MFKNINILVSFLLNEERSDIGIHTPIIHMNLSMGVHICKLVNYENVCTFLSDTNLNNNLAYFMLMVTVLPWKHEIGDQKAVPSRVLQEPISASTIVHKHHDDNTDPEFN